MTSEPPTEAAKPASKRARSLILVNTGDGKGKTTSAMGVVVRALARSWAVCVFQFVKSGDWNSGEAKMLADLGAEWHFAGDGFTWEVDDLDHSAEIAQREWNRARSAIAEGRFDLVVLDEITYPINWGWIDVTEVVSALARRPSNVNVMITGRDAPDAIVTVADTVTEMRKVRHAFDAGIDALRGIDY